MMADFGAEVIKIEDRERLDLTRTLPPFPGKVQSLGQVGKFPDPNSSGIFNNHNRNKRGIVLNMRDPRGREICRRLIGRSDIVSENFRPGVMERWGLSYEELKQINEQIIFVRLSGLGHSGPEAGYGTAGPVVQALCGLTAMAGLPEQEPSGWGYSYMDNTAAYYGTMAMLLALYSKDITGKGQEVDVSAVEAGANLLGPDLLDFTANGRPFRRPEMPAGNRLTHVPAAPHGVFPTNEEDRWIAIAVMNDEEWDRLRSLDGAPAVFMEDRFDTAASRVCLQDELDALVSAWTREHERYDLMYRLQAAGVRAGVVQTAEDRSCRDPMIAHRGLFPLVEHAVLGTYPVEGVPFKMSESPPREDWKGGPLLGGDTEYVLTEVLGMGSGEVAELAAEGVI